MTRKAQAITINPRDNVAVALKTLHAGGKISVAIEDVVEKIELVTEIPEGHKIALRDIEEGAVIVKYGEAIGWSTRRIMRGEHVHIHNVTNEPRGEI